MQPRHYPPFRNSFSRFKEDLHDATNIRVALAFHHLFQAATISVPGTDRAATATDMDLVGTWELFNRGQPSQGELVFGLEGRWDYGTIGPQIIGFDSLASVGGTANTYYGYDPTFIMRNLYYHQGGRDAGWEFRIGKITSDQMLMTSKYLNPSTTFLSNGGTGVFTNGYPDSGLGVAGALHINDRVTIGAIVSDSNGNRFNLGDIGAGQFYKGVELDVKIAPRTPAAGYSKFMIWHNDGTSDGTPINGSTGRPGWGFSVILEQEIDAEGRAILIGRYGRAFNGAAVYKEQAGVNFVYKEPFFQEGDDMFGVGFNWFKSVVPDARDEYNFEAFYRFPLFPELDATVSYQNVINPALTTLFDNASVFSLRLVAGF